MEAKEYNNLVKSIKPKQNKLKTALNAFLMGGIVALIGQFIFEMYSLIPHMSNTNAATLMIVTIIFITSLLTGLGIFDELAAVGGAGLFIPITGFSNAVTSATLEGKSEGPIFGMGSNMFKLAGSVIAYGVVSSFLVNLIRVIFMAIGG